MVFRLLPAVLAATIALQDGASAPRPADRPRPQDDLYRHVNAAWLDRTEIPAERVTVDSFAEAGERVDQALHAIVLEAVANPRGGDRRRVADMYVSITDVEAIEARGLEPMRPLLDRIDGVDNPTRLAETAGILSATATGGPFDGAMVADPANPRRLTVSVNQGGTLLPERDHYFRTDRGAVELRARYLAYLTQLFRALGRNDPADEAGAVLALETEIARAQVPADKLRDPSYQPVRYRLADLEADMPGFDWLAWGRPQGLTGSVVLAQPSFFKAFAALVSRTPYATWRAWLRARYLTAVSPYVGEAFGMARFEFFGRFLTGQQEPRPRWRRGVSMVGGYLPDAVGRLYVERHFPPGSRRQVQRIAEHVQTAFRGALEHAPWLSAGARREALRKLSRLRIQVGYPDAWRDYSTLIVRPDDLLGNLLRAQAFENAQKVARARGRDDARFWPVAAHSFNAVHDPAGAQILVPAGLLQPPFFEAGADDAMNYGGIGGVIGHELSHAFDIRGRRYDASGDERDWWSPEDEQAFLQIAGQLVAHASSWPAVDGEPIDGARTLIENAADLAGLSVAYRAYRASLAGQEPPVIDGLTGDQRFFVGWARAWRAKIRPEYVRQTRLTASHAPAVFRVNGIVQHLDAFYTAFEVREGDRLYRPPGARLRIW